MAERAGFDPDRMAYLETEGWRAYYDRKWLRAFFLLARLCREQFRLSFLGSLRAAYYATRASLAFAPKRNRPEVARDYLAKFYRLARPAIGVDYDAEAVADLELRYWVVHRERVAEADKGPLERSLAELHAAIFGTGAEEMAASGARRAAAATAVDRITSRRSTDVAADWRAVEENLQVAYREILHAVDGARPART
jgi:hypothetical protein